MFVISYRITIKTQRKPPYFSRGRMSEKSKRKTEQKANQQNNQEK